MRFEVKEQNTHRKVFVTGHDLKFWRALQAHLVATGLFEFKEDEWKGHNEHDPKRTLAGIEWADIIVAEWALGNAVFCAKHKKAHQRLVTRLHLQERNTDYPSQVDYEKIDQVIFVGAHIQEECIKKFNMPRHKTCVIGNFLDQAKFDLNKFGGCEFNLGLIGTAPSRKRLDLALDTLENLLKKDDRYMLHVKGLSPQSYSWLWARTKERGYYERVYERINSSDQLRYSVIFDPPGDDVHRWFQKIGYILSPSDFESFHMAVAEGMCSGAIPVVWNWEGANSIYPLLELFNTPQQAASFIDKLRLSNTSPRFEGQCVKFIKENYDSAIIRDQWIKALVPSYQSLAGKRSRQLPKKLVLLVYLIDKWEFFHRREMLEALANQISLNFDMLVIEPGTHYATLLEKGMCSKEELDNYAQLKPIQVGENIFKIRTLFGAMPSKVHTHSELRSVRNHQQAVQVAAKEIFGYEKELVHWIYKPNHRDFVPDEQPFIYEVYDEYTRDFGTGNLIHEMVEMEPAVLASADHTFFTSKPLAERKKHHCQSWSIVGNGVNFDAFDTYRVVSTSKEKSSLRPSVGYLGNLSDFFNWQLVAEVVEAMPDVDFFFHGQVEHHRLGEVKDQVEKVFSFPNTYFSGRVVRSVGSAAINRYDVLIIPFVVNEAMDAVNPLKLWEYLATGSPIVMTPMDAVREDILGLWFAESTVDWVEKIRLGFVQSPQNREVRIKAAKDNSWDVLTKAHASILYGCVNKNGEVISNSSRETVV